MPYFKFIIKFNLYEYLIDKFNGRYDSFTGLEYKVADSDSNYILDYSWWVLVTNLKYLSPTSDNFVIFIPIFILHTWDKVISSWDKLFTWLKLEKNFVTYTQYITGWNNYIEIWKEIINKKKYLQTIYLGWFYTYCSMSQTWRIDAYYYDRYIEWNKVNTDKYEFLIAGSYVCENNRTAKVCPNWYYECNERWCINECYDGWWDFTSKKKSCDCYKKWEYFVCEDKNGLNCYTWVQDSYGACIKYYTWTINLNNTNCSLTWLLWTGTNAKYFLLR